jgi:hypothetical protein
MEALLPRGTPGFNLEVKLSIAAGVSSWLLQEFGVQMPTSDNSVVVYFRSGAKFFSSPLLRWEDDGGRNTEYHSLTTKFGLQNRT